MDLIWFTFGDLSCNSSKTLTVLYAKTPTPLRMRRFQRYHGVVGGSWSVKSRHGTGETTKWQLDAIGRILWRFSWDPVASTVVSNVSQTVDFILVREKWNSVSQHCWKGRFAGTVVLGNMESRRISSWDFLWNEDYKCMWFPIRIITRGCNFLSISL